VSRRRAERAKASTKAIAQPVGESLRDDDSPGDDAPSAVASSSLVGRLWRFRAQYRDGRDAEKVLRAALKLSMDVFGAGEGAVASVGPGAQGGRIILSLPADSVWDTPMLAGFLRGDKVRVPAELMLARIRRHGRMWGAIAVRAPGAGFHWDSRQAFSEIGALANELIDEIDRERIREVRARVDRKVLEQSHPKHLSYELLHGIRSLTGYDHSAALLIHDDESGSLEVVAEQIAWQKAKGQNVGRKLPLPANLRELLKRPFVCGFHRQGRGWTNWTGTDATGLAELLDYDQPANAGAAPQSGSASGPGIRVLTPPEGAILCASLATRDGLLGILKIAAIEPSAFCRYEVDLISQFLPQAAVALQNARRAESLEQRMLMAERKHAMADLARGVSHDVNNALGAVLPLVQQLREELEQETLDPAVAAVDLRQVEHSIQVCRRIFGAMVHFARGRSRNPSEVSIRQAVDGVMAIFREGLERRGVRLVIDVPADLPPLFAVQADVQQLLLNLISNASDATGPDGEVSIRAARQDGLLEVLVADTGCGIPREHLAKIQEPFFTTKANGHGLGLAICRSIVAQLRGQLQIDSAPGTGTRIRAVFPIAVEEG
jgi:two-component system, NtrC family, sensor kinase